MYICCLYKTEANLQTAHIWSLLMTINQQYDHMAFLIRVLETYKAEFPLLMLIRRYCSTLLWQSQNRIILLLHLRRLEYFTVSYLCGWFYLNVDNGGSIQVVKLFFWLLIQPSIYHLLIFRIILLRQFRLPRRIHEEFQRHQAAL